MTDKRIYSVDVSNGYGIVETYYHGGFTENQLSAIRYICDHAGRDPVPPNPIPMAPTTDAGWVRFGRDVDGRGTFYLGDALVLDESLEKSVNETRGSVMREGVLSVTIDRSPTGLRLPDDGVSSPAERTRLAAEMARPETTGRDLEGSFRRGWNPEDYEVTPVDVTWENYLQLGLEKSMVGVKGYKVRVLRNQGDAPGQPRAGINPVRTEYRQAEAPSVIADAVGSHHFGAVVAVGENPDGSTAYGPLWIRDARPVPEQGPGVGLVHTAEVDAGVVEKWMRKERLPSMRELQDTPGYELTREDCVRFSCDVSMAGYPAASIRVYGPDPGEEHWRGEDGVVRTFAVMSPVPTVTRSFGHPPVAGPMRSLATDQPPGKLVNTDYNHGVAKRETANRSGYTGDACTACGSMMVRRTGTCTVCENCGASGGCG